MTGGQFAIKQIATQDRLLPLCPLLWIADQAKPLNLLFNAGQRFSQSCCKDRVRSGLRTCGHTKDMDFGAEVLRKRIKLGLQAS